MKFLPLNHSATPQPPSQDPTWERAEDWPPLERGSGELIGLKAIMPGDENYLALYAEGDYTVDWGDGAVEDFVSGATAEHRYNYADISMDTWCDRGYKQVIVKLSHRGASNITTINLDKKHSALTYACEIGWLDIIVDAPELVYFTIEGSSSNGFTHLLEQISLYENKIQSFVGKFDGCVSLRSLPVLYTSAGTVFDLMFWNCTSLEVAPLFDLTNCHYDIGDPFQGAADLFWNCKSLKSVPAYDFSHAHSVAGLFRDCTSLKEIPFLNISGVHDLTGMFRGCLALETIPLLDTSQAHLMVDMFLNCVNLKSIPLIDTYNCSDFSEMFQGCRSLVTIPEIDTRNGAGFASMFEGCSSLDHIPVIDTSGGEINEMFAYCYSLRSVPALDMSYTYYGSGMFRDCYSLTEVPPVNVSTRCHTFTSMFNGCRSLKSVTITGDTSSVYTAESMFEGCTSLTQVPLFDTSNVTNFREMFNGCTSLKSVPLFDTSKGTNFIGTFYNCKSLVTIPHIDTSSGTDFSSMFRYSSAFASVPPLDTSSTSSQYYLGYMFHECPSLTSGALLSPQYNISYAGCKLDRQAIIDVFNSLAVVATTRNVNVSSNPGTSSLTADDLLIATSKNWTVTTT